MYSFVNAEAPKRANDPGAFLAAVHEAPLQSEYLKRKRWDEGTCKDQDLHPWQSEQDHDQQLPGDSFASWSSRHPRATRRFLQFQSNWLIRTSQSTIITPSSRSMHDTLCVSIAKHILECLDMVLWQVIQNKRLSTEFVNTLKNLVTCCEPKTWKEGHVSSHHTFFSRILPSWNGVKKRKEYLEENCIQRL